MALRQKSIPKALVFRPRVRVGAGCWMWERVPQGVGFWGWVLVVVVCKLFLYRSLLFVCVCVCGCPFLGLLMFAFVCGCGRWLVVGGWGGCWACSTIEDNFKKVGYLEVSCLYVFLFFVVVFLELVGGFGVGVFVCWWVWLVVFGCFLVLSGVCFWLFSYPSGFFPNSSFLPVWAPFMASQTGTG